MDLDIHRYWHTVSDVMDATSLEPVARAADLLFDCYQRSGTVFVLGNGGSSATAAHLTCDLGKGTRVDGRPAFRAACLTDNIPLLTAWSNDSSYDDALAEQLATFVTSNDVVVAISVSGNSANVLNAVSVARHAGVPVIGLTGQSGGKLAESVDLSIRVPSDMPEVAEDVHLITAHSICRALHRRLREQPLPSETMVRMFEDGWRPAAAHPERRIYAEADNYCKLESGELRASSD